MFNVYNRPCFVVLKQYDNDRNIEQRKIQPPGSAFTAASVIFVRIIIRRTSRNNDGYSNNKNSFIALLIYELIRFGAFEFSNRLYNTAADANILMMRMACDGLWIIEADTARVIRPLLIIDIAYTG